MLQYIHVVSYSLKICSKYQLILRLLSQTSTVHSYSDNDEVKPTPGVCEVLLEAIGSPFSQHFKNKNDRKRFVHHLQNMSESPSFLDIHVFDCLRKTVDVSINSVLFVGERGRLFHCAMSLFKQLTAYDIMKQSKLLPLLLVSPSNTTMHCPEQLCIPSNRISVALRPDRGNSVPTSQIPLQTLQ